MKLAWSPQARLKYSAVLLDVRDKNGYQSAQKLNKEVYHVDGIYISIDNIWDTRREPKIQVEETTK